MKEVKLNVVPKKEYYDCTDCVNSNFFNFYNLDYRTSLIDSFGFKYSKAEHFLNNTLKSSSISRKDIINRYTAMDSFRLKVKNESIEEYMQQYFNTNPFIGVELDTHYCSWIKYYHSRYHSLLITNYNKNKKECLVYDTFFNSEEQKIDFENFHIGYKAFFYLIPKKLNRDICYYELPRKLAKLLNENPEQKRAKITDFVNDIIDLEYDNKYNTENINMTRFIFTFTSFIWSRIKAVDYFNMINENACNNKNIKIIDNLQICIDYWKKLRAYLIRNILMRQNICNKYIEILSHDLIKVETEMIMLINQY